MPELRSYQREGLEFLRKHPRAYIGDEMGLGKSAQMLLSTEGKTLIVAPAMVFDGGTWRDEIEKWAPERAEDFTCVPYTSLCVRDGRKVLPVAKPEYRGRWDSVILDEAQYIKGRKTTWVKPLDKIVRMAGRAVLGSGTPIPNWAEELFTALRMLYPEKVGPGRELNSYWRWAERWFDTTPEIIYVRGEQKEVSNVGQLLGCTQLCEEHPPTDPCEHYRAFFTATLGDRFIQRLRDDVLTDLPPLTVETVECPMVKRQGVAYRKLKKDYLAEMTDGTLKVAWSSSAAHVMADKVSTGLEVLDPAAVSASGKLERLRYDLAQRTRPTLVVAHFRAAVEAAVAVARGLGMKAEFVHGGTSRPERRRIVEEFKRGDLAVLIGSLETIAEGLTLTAADVVIFLETSYKPSRNQQAMRRIHRIGQERPCTVLDYVTPGTVDENKRELLATKTDHQIRTLSHAQMRELL